MSLTPRDQRHVDRIAELIEEGQEVLATQQRSQMVGRYFPSLGPVSAWIAKVRNIVHAAFGATGPQSDFFTELVEDGVKSPTAVESVTGFLEGAKDDLEKGYLQNQEFVIAGEVFDSLLEEAGFLHRAGHVQCAAVLGRVVLEDSLRRLAADRELDPNGKASAVNQRLRDDGAWGKPKWRQIQAWLDVGNAAAHGDTENYSEVGVAAQLEGVAGFVIQYISGD